jgi:hypothetical protein
MLIENYYAGRMTSLYRMAQLVWLLSILVVATSAHFVLQVPTSLGFNDALEATAPCDGFDIGDRSKGVTDWPVNGAPVQILTTHPDVQLEIKAALLSNTSSFKFLVPVVAQHGVGTFCIPSVPGIADWVGQQAVFQMIQHAPDGALYQVRAITLPPGPS